MENVDKSFADKFRLEELTIRNTESWIISLRPQQPTLGSLVLSLKRKCETFSQINEEESRDLHIAFKEIDKILASTFKPEKINYLALMMVDNQVHFHVIPRYSKPIFFKNGEFVDNKWPGPPSLENIEMDSIQFSTLLEALRS